MGSGLHAGIESGSAAAEEGAFLRRQPERTEVGRLRLRLIRPTPAISLPRKRRHAFDLDQHRRIRQRLHHAGGAGRDRAAARTRRRTTRSSAATSAARVSSTLTLTRSRNVAPASSSTRLRLATTKPNWASKLSGSTPFSSKPGMPETNSRSPVRVAKESGRGFDARRWSEVLDGHGAPSISVGRVRPTRSRECEAVRLIKERGVSYAQASKDLGVHPTQLRNWVKQLADDPQHAFPGQGQMKPEQLEIAQLKREVAQAEGRAGHPKKSRGLLREGIDVKFGFIAKHRGIWPAEWLCEALGVSRGGFYAWLTRPRSRRSRSDEELGAKARASFLASDRTYGARRVWHDLLAEGISCGLHRIERLMRLQALRARPATAAPAARSG